MPRGPGKYDDICTQVRKASGAQGVVLMIVDGTHGHGFSIQVATRDIQHEIAGMLRQAADQIEADVKNLSN